MQYFWTFSTGLRIQNVFIWLQIRNHHLPNTDPDPALIKNFQINLIFQILLNLSRHAVYCPTIGWIQIRQSNFDPDGSGSTKRLYKEAVGGHSRFCDNTVAQSTQKLQKNQIAWKKNCTNSRRERWRIGGRYKPLFIHGLTARQWPDFRMGEGGIQAFRQSQRLHEKREQAIIFS